MKFNRALLAMLAGGLTAALAAQPTHPSLVPPSGAVEACTIIPVPPPMDTDLIQITADRADCTYPLGASPTFRIAVALAPYPAAGIRVQYRLGPEQFEGPEQTVVVPANGLVIPVGTRLDPGLTRLIVTATIAEIFVKALGTIAFAPGLIRPTQTEPTDFDSFWEAQKAELAKIPAETELTPLPERSTSEVEVFHWSSQNIGTWRGYSRIYGILAVPRGPGPYPALLEVPGAGVRSYKGSVALAARGVITLEIGIHGIPVNLAPDIYQQLARAALAEYPSTSLDDRNNYYYRRVYLGCIRANDYLTGHPKWDKKTLVVVGGSQGGMLSIITAGLDPRVTALGASFPAFCDVTGYLHGRAGGWPGFFRPKSDGKLQVLAPDEPRLVTTSFYDTVNFARRLKVPGHYSFGYNDAVCPPTSVLAAYNIISAPKELVISPEQAHHLSKPQMKSLDDWIDAQLGVK